MQAVGTLWLIEQFKPAPVVVSQRSYIAGKRISTTLRDGQVEETYPKSYWPGDTALDHVAFALKHEPVSLDLLHQVFRNIPAGEVDAYIATNPTGKYARRIGFLYELLTTHELRTKVAGNFVSVLDEKRYFTGKPHLDQRWRVRNNLLGSAGFCPIIRRTPEATNVKRTRAVKRTSEQIHKAPLREQLTPAVKQTTTNHSHHGPITNL